MKRKIICAALTMTMIGSMLAGCGAKKDEPEQTAAATKATQTQAQATSGVPGELDLEAFGLSTTLWSSPDGLTVNLTAFPSVYTEGQNAHFLVTLNGEEVVNALCQWNGTDYTASADLVAANGYNYYVVLSDASGTQIQVPVNTPDQPYDINLINLDTALTAYCTVTLDEVSVTQSAISVVSGTALAQMPQISKSSQTVTCTSAVLVLSLNGTTVQTQPLTLEQAEVPGSYVQDLKGISFTVPAMTEGQELDLRMDVILSDGQQINAPGGNWAFKNGALESTVG